jgi:hypothetical protein
VHTNILKPFINTFFARSKESIQRAVAVKPKRLDSKAPGSSVFGSPREALYRGGGKKSARS